jgi:hypothetical protein
LIFLTALGPIANLLTAAVAALLLLLSPGSPWAGYWVTLAMLASVSFASGIANFIPSRGSEHYSDGAQIWQMALKGPWCDYRTFREFQALSKTTPQSPADWPEASVVMTADFPDTPASRVENLVAASLHFRMKGNLERAGVYISQAGELLSTLSQARKDLLGPEIAMFEAVYRQDFATAAIWLKESSRWSLSGSRLARAALAAHENRLDEGRLAWETAWSRIVSSPPTGVRIAREQAAEHVARRWYPEFLARVERERCGGPEPELLTCMAASTILQSGGSTL